MRIFIAVPLHDGKLFGETCKSLIQEQAAALVSGDEIQVSFLPGCSLVTLARNKLVKDFMESGADRLVFVDSDVSWPVGSLLKLAHHDADVVGGAYRLKSDKEAYPVLWKQGKGFWSDARGLIEVDALPGGFLAIRRSVFEQFRHVFPERAFTFQNEVLFAWFHAPFADGVFAGEDTTFCLEWQKLGGSVWLDPEIALTHHGGLSGYAGHVGNWLKAGGLE